MLVHFRLTVPPHLVSPVEDLLVDDPRVTNVVHFPGVARRPKGDVFEADVAREAASEFLDAFDEMGLDECGGIVVSQPLGTPFDGAHDVEEAAHGDPDDAVIWHLLAQEAEEASRPTPSYMVFLLIATALASVAVITDSSVLVVGAMVVGPEFSVVASIATAVALTKWRLAVRSFVMLLLTFAIAIVVITLVAWIGAKTGVLTPHDVTRPRPQTQFIWRPDVWSFIVALLAGAAGVMAMATDKASAMVGVFISVTTVPAAGNLALGLAIWDPAEINGSLGQLALNLFGMVLAGVFMLLLERLVWRRLDSRHRRKLLPKHFSEAVRSEASTLARELS